MPYSEDKPISVKDVIDQIHSKNFNDASDSIKDLLYKKSGEAMQDKKLEVARSIAQPEDSSAAESIPGFDATDDVVNAPTETNPIEFETPGLETSEE